MKTWSAPQLAHVHSTTQAIFSHVDGTPPLSPRGLQVRSMSAVGLVQRRLGVGQAQAGDSVKVLNRRFDWSQSHGYVHSPPFKETVAAHLCPAAAKTLGSDISLPSKPYRTTAHLANKAYASDGEAASALHAKLLRVAPPTQVIAAHPTTKVFTAAILWYPKGTFLILSPASIGLWSALCPGFSLFVCSSLHGIPPTHLCSHPALLLDLSGGCLLPSRCLSAPPARLKPVSVR